MKFLPSFILSLILITSWSCSDLGPYQIGCIAESACNYDETATDDDGSCWYPPSVDCNCTGLTEESCDCAGNTNDLCGECGGDNSSCVNYAEEIQPIFDNNCEGCHVILTLKDLNLSDWASTTSGSSASGPVIIPGNSGQSLLWQLVDSGYMPQGSSNLTDAQIALIATWIDEGALNN